MCRGLAGVGRSLCRRILLETEVSKSPLTEQFSLSDECVAHRDAVNLDHGVDAWCVLCPCRCWDLLQRAGVMLALVNMRPRGLMP